VRRYEEKYEEWNERDEENLDLASELVRTIFFCRELINRGETSSVNVTYFTEHSKDTIYRLNVWNEMYQDSIQRINEKIKQISEIGKDKSEGGEIVNEKNEL